MSYTMNDPNYNTAYLNEGIKNKIALLGCLHGQIIRYIGINIVGITIWALSGGGYFWPVWVIILWGFDLLYQAHRLNLLKNTMKYKDKIFNMTKKWEDQQAASIMRDGSSTETSSSSVSRINPIKVNPAYDVKKWHDPIMED